MQAPILEVIGNTGAVRLKTGLKQTGRLGRTWRTSATCSTRYEVQCGNASRM